MKATYEIVWGKRPPYVRKVTEFHANGKKKIWWMVDNRQVGTPGGRERYETYVDAEARAKQLLQDKVENGDTAPLPRQLRDMAERCSVALGKFDKTIDDATRHYINFLKEEEKRANSATVGALVEQWLASKKDGKRKKLKPKSIKDIEYTAAWLKERWGDKRIGYVTTADVEEYLDSLDIELQTKENRRNRLSQFFSWAVRKGYRADNPASTDKIEIIVPNKSVEILSVSDCETIMQLTERPEHKGMKAYFALAIFAGVRPWELHRPGDMNRLRWEHINFENRQIFVPQAVSKISEDRYIHIEDNLLEWLMTCAGRRGYVAIVDDNAFRRAFDGIRKVAGFKVNGTKKGRAWVEDCCRHSYASFHLALYKNRAALQENMGHSNGKTIGKHYKAAMPVSETKAFWSIVPTPLRKAAEEKAAREEAEAREWQEMMDGAEEAKRLNGGEPADVDEIFSIP